MTKPFTREIQILRSQLHKDVLALIDGGDAFVAGGAITSIFSSNAINDFDVFFRSAKAAESAIARNKSEDPIVTDCAFSFKLDDRRYQFIKIVTGDPETVIKTFDWTVCQGAYTKDGFVFVAEFFQHLAQRRLVFNIANDLPISALYRVRKYLKRGFSLSGIEAIKLGLRIQSLDIDNYKELRRQIMGIDTLFLRELTDALKNDGEKKYEMNEFLATLDKWLEKLDTMTGDD